MIYNGFFFRNDISFESVADATSKILLKAQTDLPSDIIRALQSALGQENNEVAKAHLSAILKNIEFAGNNRIPMCQDTGIPIFFVDVGNELHIDFDLSQAIAEGVRHATDQIPLRPNAVDPLTRINSGDNTGNGIPDINYSFVEGNELCITVAPKGAGSENMSALKMFNPTEVSGIHNFILETVLNAGGMPCPPVIVGVGIGGTFDKSARLAKKALLEDTDDMNEMERELLAEINSLGIGPMGMGGNTTALAVHIKKAHCHTASLPVAVNIQCWANRHATCVFGGE